MVVDDDGDRRCGQKDYILSARSSSSQRLTLRAIRGPLEEGEITSSMIMKNNQAPSMADGRGDYAYFRNFMLKFFNRDRLKKLKSYRRRD